MEIKGRKIQIVIYLLAGILLMKLVAWLDPDLLQKQVERDIHWKMGEFIIYVMQNANVKTAYVLRDDSTVMEKLVKNANSDTSSVYSFVEYQYSKQNLIRYAPASGKEEQTQLAQKKEEEKESDEVRENGEKEDQVPVSEETTAATGETGENVGTEVPVQETFSPVFSLEQIMNYDFLRSNLYIVPERASVLPEDLNGEKLLSMDMSIEKDASVPQILIYHTHGSETFVDSTEDLKGTGIIAVGAKLAEVLSNQYGYNVIHCTEIFDHVNGVFDRSKAYDYSRQTVQQILTDHPTIQVMIDLHRDGVREDLHLVTDVNGKPTAQIMFFNGVSRSSAKGEISYLYNQYRSENLSFSLQAKLEALGKYPDFTRKNYIDAYQYNLDLLPRAMLIEAGAQTNTLQEELNAMELLGDVLDGVLSGKSREHLGLSVN